MSAKIAIAPDISLERSIAARITRRLCVDKGRIQPLVAQSNPFQGSGTLDDPYLVDWLPGEVANPLNWKKGFRWLITVHLAINCLCPVFCGSSYVAAIPGIMACFPPTSEELGILGLSLYVLGQAFGPLLWAPLSEIVGRRLSFLVAFPIFVLFNLAGAVAQNVATIMVTRFLAGVYGAGQLAVIGGQMADLWEMNDRIIPGSLATLSPLLGPVIGPIVSGFVGEKAGWRAVFWVQFGFGAATLVAWYFLIPETYPPILLKRKAARLQGEAEASGTGEHFKSKYEVTTRTPMETLRRGLGKPFELLFLEVIVWTLSGYLSLVYGILYLLFTAFPYIFVTLRGWSAGMTGLALIGIGIGRFIGFVMNKLQLVFYSKARAVTPAHLPVPPEVRLKTCCIGAILVPISLFWFAWTSKPDVHWIVPIIASVPFGTGYLLIFTSILLYLIDTYTIFAASALAANTVMRAAFGAAFPLFGTYMYKNLGADWAGTLLAFLSLACVPIPFLFVKYGHRLRASSKYAPSAPIATDPDVTPDTVELNSWAAKGGQPEPGRQGGYDEESLKPIA
ncbi:hypothetical protein JCM24511_00837 [Saitozyma sp. JCM 24511]|nr:hypothetical protein JCM24511_00837 [Saitozyma sp. JCM 24511]